MYGGGGGVGGAGADVSVDDYHVAMSPSDLVTPGLIGKFFPSLGTSTAADSAVTVAHYDTAGRLTDVAGPPCTGWHPAVTLPVVEPATTCYQPSTAVRLQGAPAWQMRRRGDHEHEYELPK